MYMCIYIYHTYTHDFMVTCGHARKLVAVEDLLTTNLHSHSLPQLRRSEVLSAALSTYWPSTKQHNYFMACLSRVY